MRKIVELAILLLSIVSCTEEEDKSTQSKPSLSDSYFFKIDLSDEKLPTYYQYTYPINYVRRSAIIISNEEYITSPYRYIDFEYKMKRRLYISNNYYCGNKNDTITEFSDNDIKDILIVPTAYYYHNYKYKLKLILDGRISENRYKLYKELFPITPPEKNKLYTIKFKNGKPYIACTTTEFNRD